VTICQQNLGFFGKVKWISTIPNLSIYSLKNRNGIDFIKKNLNMYFFIVVKKRIFIDIDIE